jgi:hypothetical protein
MGFELLFVFRGRSPSGIGEAKGSIRRELQRTLVVFDLRLGRRPNTTTWSTGKPWIGWPDWRRSRPVSTICWPAWPVPARHEIGGDIYERVRRAGLTPYVGSSAAVGLTRAYGGREDPRESACRSGHLRQPRSSLVRSRCCQAARTYRVAQGHTTGDDGVGRSKIL